MSHSTQPLQVRWLGRVDYREAWDLQQRLHRSDDDYLLLLEHPPVYTLGASADEANLVSVDGSGAEVIKVNRGGDVTFHGPGQIVGYPILSVPGKRGGGMADTAAYVGRVEQFLIDVVAELGITAGRVDRYPGVWAGADTDEPAKLAAIGVRLTRGRSMHGFALNVDVDLDWFSRIVPCGITEFPVASLAAQGVDAGIEEVVDIMIDRADVLRGGQSVFHVDFDSSAAEADGRRRPSTVSFAGQVFRQPQEDLAAFTRGLGPGDPVAGQATSSESSDTPAPGQAATRSTATPDAGVPVRLGRRLTEAGVDPTVDIGWRKPSWMRVKLETGETFRHLKATSRSLGLTTVCEEAGCPNIFECWNEGTATFMLLGERCTRACGFCLVDTRKPGLVDEAEPERVAAAVRDLGIDFAVLTMVARDDLDDGGAAVVARTVDEIRVRAPGVGVEVLISDLAGSAQALDVVCRSKPDVVNHNIETVARLQRAVRPSASYARSLTVLARAADAGMLTKSGMIVGMGEDMDEVVTTMADLKAVGVDIVTVGQYLRPTSHHLPVARWWTPDEFAEIKQIGESDLGIAHVEASPLTRSSHHAGSVVERLAAEPGRTRS